MSPKRPELDDSATFVGILLGIVIGALYALLHIKQKGSVRRKDLMQFGAARPKWRWKRASQKLSNWRDRA